MWKNKGTGLEEKEECTNCDGEGLVDFTDEEVVAMYGVGYTFVGNEPETMKRCPKCRGSGCRDKISEIYWGLPLA